jgi:hypothetical protein
MRWTRDSSAVTRARRSALYRSGPYTIYREDPGSPFAGDWTVKKGAERIGSAGTLKRAKRLAEEAT